MTPLPPGVFASSIDKEEQGRRKAKTTVDPPTDMEILVRKSQDDPTEDKGSEDSVHTGRQVFLKGLDTGEQTPSMNIH